MKKVLSSQQSDTIASIYKKYAHDVRKYIAVSIQDEIEAEDMTHEIFEHAMQIDIISEETAHSLLIIMAKRKVIDYFRHKAIARGAMKDIAYAISEIESSDPAMQMTVKQVLRLEQTAINRLNGKEALVYQCWRQGDKTMKEMALELNINNRSIERYIYNSRRKVTEYIRKAI